MHSDALVRLRCRDRGHRRQHRRRTGLSDEPHRPAARRIAARQGKMHDRAQAVDPCPLPRRWPWLLCGSDDDDGLTPPTPPTTTARRRRWRPSTTSASCRPDDLRGRGLRHPITHCRSRAPGSPAAATITNTEAGPFVVDALNAGGDVTVNLVDRIGTMRARCPSTPSTAQEKTAGLRYPGARAMEGRVQRPAGPTGPYGGRPAPGTPDDVFLYVVSPRPGGFTFQGQGTVVLIADPSINGGFLEHAGRCSTVPPTRRPGSRCPAPPSSR